MSNLSVCCSIISGLLAFTCAVAIFAAEQHVVLREHINRQWTNELVTYPFTAPNGTCHPDSVSLTGPKGRVPVQLSAVQYWPETGWVKSGVLSFVTDLDALGAQTYTVLYGEGLVESKAVATDLSVTPREGSVELVTSRFGIRLLPGERTYR